MLKKSLVISLVVVVVVAAVINFYGFSTTQSKVSYKNERLISNSKLFIPYVYRNNNYKNLLLLLTKIDIKNSNIKISDEKSLNNNL